MLAPAQDQRSASSKLPAGPGVDCLVPGHKTPGVALTGKDFALEGASIEF